MEPAPAASYGPRSPRKRRGLVSQCWIESDARNVCADVVAEASTCVVQTEQGLHHGPAFLVCCFPNEA